MTTTSKPQGHRPQTHSDKAVELIKQEATTGIIRHQALKLKDICYEDSDGHDCMGWERLEELIHQAGFSTIIFPMAEGKSYNRNTRNFKMYWAMVDRGSSNWSLCQSKLTDDDNTEQIVPIYCYGTLMPVQDFVGGWMQMNLKRVGYVAYASPIQAMLAKRTKWSSREGRGSSAAENWVFWCEDFDREWPEGTDRVLLPECKLPIKRLKFTYVCLQPETTRIEDAWAKDHPQTEDS